MTTKICTKCKEEKETSEFGKDKSRKDGLNLICKHCIHKYYIENKDYIKNNSKEYRKNNKESIAEYKKEYQQKNKESIAEYHKDWNIKNKEIVKQNRKEYYIKNKDKRNEYYKEWSSKNKKQLKEYLKEYNFNHKEEAFARSSLNNIFNNWKGSRMKYENLFGYTINDLKEHLSKFGDIKKLTVDHIIPINYLATLINNKEELAKWLNKLSNLMLLDASLNSSKHAKLTIEYIPSWHLFDFIDYCLELDEFILSQDPHHHQDH
jgi:hypothetical protein